MSLSSPALRQLSTFTLLLLVTTLLLVVPVRCLCSPDLHFGQGLHFLLPHTHPGAAGANPATQATPLGTERSPTSGPLLRQSHDAAGAALISQAGLDSLPVLPMLGLLLLLFVPVAVLTPRPPGTFAFAPPLRPPC